MTMVLGVHGFHRFPALMAAPLLVFFAPETRAENAVLNPGFETYYQAPWMVSQLNSRSGYCDPLDPSQAFRYDGLASSSPNLDSPWSGCSTDLFTEDGAGFASTKSPLFAYTTEVKPRTGKAMAGFHPLEMLADGSNAWFERVGGTLSAPLQPGVRYDIRFHTLDFFEGADASILNLKLQIAFQNGRFRDSASSVNHPTNVPGSLELSSARRENGWNVYEGSLRPTQGDLTHFLIGVLKAHPVPGEDFHPLRPKTSRYSSYYFLDDVEVSCTYELHTRFPGTANDQDPATPEFDVFLPQVARNGDYEVDGSLSRNTGAHRWIVEEIDAAGSPIAPPLRISSKSAPGTIRLRFREHSRYRITLEGGCHASTTRSIPILVRTGQYRIEDTIGNADPVLKEGLGCDPGLALRLEGDSFSCGGDLEIDATAQGAESHEWVLRHLPSGRTRVRTGTGNPAPVRLSRLFPGLIDAGTYTLSLRGRCGADLPWSEKSRSFEIQPLPIDWSASPGLELPVNRILRASASGDLPQGTSFLWEFEDGPGQRSLSGREAEFAWPERGEYRVMLKATRPNGCASSAQKTVRIVDPRIFVPDAFTPNGDLRNDTFRPVSRDLAFTLRIYDRWGGKIYEETHDPSLPEAFRGWDGRVNGAEPMAGVYGFWIGSHSEEPFELRGTVNLLR